jgi:hypothetical protein
MALDEFGRNSTKRVDLPALLLGAVAGLFYLRVNPLPDQLEPCSRFLTSAFKR